jgi:Dolichyl-phosphate-mannose-protein mannosyltransferase
MSQAAASVRARAVAVPAWLWLGAIVAASIALRLVLDRRMVAPWIMVDELIYSELAKSVAAHGSFLIRGEPAHGFGFLYPILIAPAFRIGSVPTAYGVAKAIDTVIMSLAAIPAYLLARRLMRPGLALLAALLTVAVPSMVYTGTLMTENAFYPLFLGAALALVLVLERPTWWRIAVLLALTLLAFLTRAQAVALAPAILTAPLLLGRSRLREFRGLYALVVAGGVLVVLFEAARGRTPLAVLGAYRVTTSAHYSAGGILKWLLYHVGELDLYVGVAPFAAFIFLLATRERRSPFLAATASLTAWLVLEVAVFAATQSQRIEERNMFFVAPFFFIALCLWVERGLPRPRAAALSAVIAAALVGVVPYDGLINGNATSDTLALIPLWTLQDTLISLDEVGAFVLVGGIAVALLVLYVPARAAVALPLLVLALDGVALWAIETNPHGGIHHASVGALYGGTAKPERDWIDRALGRDAHVAVIYDSRTMDKFTVWTNEFFNRSLRGVYDVAGPTPGSLPETPVHVDPRTGRIAGIDAPYVLTSEALALDEKRVLADPVKGLAVYRVVRPLGVRSTVTGISPDSWSGPTASYTAYRCVSGERLRATVAGDTKLIRTESVVTATSGGRRFELRVPHGATRTLSVPLTPVDGRCVVRFSILPVAQPAAVEPGSTDTRVLGIRFLRLETR